MSTSMQSAVLYRQPLNYISAISIKRLTYLGFGMVVFPLILALLYSVNQVNALAKLGENAVFKVADLNQTNRELSLTISKMERLAGQYVVLQEEDLYKQFQLQANVLTTDISSALIAQQDEILSRSVHQFIEKINTIAALLAPDVRLSIELSALQKHFQQLSAINQEIDNRSNALISLQATEIKITANDVNNTMLNSLSIIPITLIIAGLFIVLITKPMKSLLAKINQLEQGGFERPISVNGAREVQEIAEALELMRTRLHALELQKSSFIRHISHELKTPLAAIREGTELIYDHSVGELNEAQQEITKIIKHSVNRLQRLIEDLLDFNIVLDSTSLQDTEIALLKPLIESVVQERKLDIRRKNITVDLSLIEVKLQCNIKQLNVILDNLLSNAIKYSPEYGVISITNQVENGHVVVAINDQGPGIDQQVREKIFDAFYQGPPPSDSAIKGSGLGLTIVKELLMRLNGDIEISDGQRIPSNDEYGQDKDVFSTKVSISLPKATEVKG